MRINQAYKGLNKSVSILLLHVFVGHGINGFSVCSNPLSLL
jgi:hypothetical protein